MKNPYAGFKGAVGGGVQDREDTLIMRQHAASILFFLCVCVCVFSSSHIYTLQFNTWGRCYPQVPSGLQYNSSRGNTCDPFSLSVHVFNF